MTSATGTREQALAQGKALLASDTALALKQGQAMLEVDPADPDALRLTAQALRQSGRMKEAQKLELKALENWQKTPILCSAAQAASSQRPADAEAILRQRLHDEPHDLAALSMLASIAANAGFLDEAEKLQQTVVDRAPDFLPARIELLQLLDEQTKFEQAFAQLSEVRRRDPGNRRWQNHAVTLHVRMGQFEEALDICESLLASEPTDQSTLIAKGNILKTLGRNADCIETFQRSIALDPGMGEAWWSLANLKTYRFSDSEMQLMQTQAQSDLPEKQRVNLDFALGTGFEKRGDAELAFHHYASGNSRWLEQIGHNADWISHTVDNLTDAITPEWFAQFAGGGSHNGAPIFIIGMPRAGSTLVDQILSSHSQIEGTAELPYIPALSRSISYRGHQNDPARLIMDLDRAKLVELGDAYLQRAQIHRAAQSRHFIDKTPNNWFFLPLIRAILPNAKIIDVRRDAMACCFSNFKQHFARGQSFTYSLSDMGRYYRDYVRLMAHFDHVAPGYVHHISYERLVADLEDEVRRALSYLGLDFEPACLEFYKNDRAVRTASAEQVRQPITGGTNEVWKPFSQWLDPLRKALGDLAEG